MWSAAIWRMLRGALGVGAFLLFLFAHPREGALVFLCGVWLFVAGFHVGVWGKSAGRVACCSADGAPVPLFSSVAGASGGWLSRGPHRVAGLPLGLPASLRLLFLLMLVLLLLLVMGVGLCGMMRW